MSEKDPQLKKHLSPVNLLALALGCIIGWGAFIMPGNSFLGAAGPIGTCVAMFIAAIVMSVIAVNYGYMIKRFPVTGGGFVYAERAFGKTHAFICAWFLTLAYVSIVQLNATALALIGRNLLGNVLAVGFHYTVAGYDVYGGEVALAIVALIVFAWLSIRGTKISGGFQTLLVALLLLGIFAVAIAAIVSPQATLENLSPAFGTSDKAFGGIMAVVAVAPWAFIGFDTVPQATEELNFSVAKTRVIMIASIFFGALVYALLTVVTASVVPEGYADWAAYIADLPNLEGLISLPTFYAAYELMGNAGVTIMVIAAFGAILSGIVGFYMASSRLLMALAREGFLPSWFGHVGKHGTPDHAIIAIMAVSFIAPFFGRTVLGWIVDMSSVGAAVSYAYTSAAAFKFARGNNAPVVRVTGFLGCILGCVFVFILLVPVPGLGASLGPESMAALIVWTVLGLVSYLLARRKYTRELKESA